MRANALPTAVLVLLGRGHARSHVLALPVALSPRQGVVLLCDFVEQNGRTGSFGGLLYRLDPFLLLAHLPYTICTPSFASAFIGNSKLIAITTAIKLSTPHTLAHPLPTPHSPTHNTTLLS